MTASVGPQRQDREWRGRNMPHSWSQNSPLSPGPPPMPATHPLPPQAAAPCLSLEGLVRLLQALPGCVCPLLFRGFHFLTP